MNDRTPFVFEIREEKYDKLVEQFTKMVGRARKCKKPAPVFSVIHEADEKLVRSTGETDSLGEWIMIEKWVRYLYVTVEGERPAVDGWNFIATIDHTEASADEAGNVTGNLIKSVPGAGEIPVSYRSARPICDHCKSARRRNETYVVRKGDVTQQIGKNCLADFLPGSSPADLAQQLAWWTEATEILSGGGDEESMGGGRREGRVGIESLLQATQATIEAFGWVSRTKARDSQDQATADRLGVLYMKESDMSRKDKEDAEKIREHYNVEKNTPADRGRPGAGSEPWTRGHEAITSTTSTSCARARPCGTTAWASPAPSCRPTAGSLRVSGSGWSTPPTRPSTSGPWASGTCSRAAW